MLAPPPILERPAPPVSPAAQVVVLGMHRSGTSALTGLLPLLGLWAGEEDDFPPADEHNQAGYWEHRGVWSVDEAILQTLGAKRQAEPVDLATTGGHVVRFPGWRLSPRRFRLRHYIFLSREQAVRKYVGKVYDPEELRDGWHGWRATLAADGVRLPSKAQLRTAFVDEDLDASSPRTTHCLLWKDV